ncbi:MAG: preprotein translocase subunit SecE [candidate division WOR-3 bacterium]
MFKKLVSFLKEVKQELYKVSWPKLKEVRISTLIVIVFSIILTVVIWFFDFIFSRIFIFLVR